MNYRLTSRAKRSIGRIHVYIADHNPTAADRLIGRIEVAIERLGDFPLIGHTRDDLSDLPFRFWSVGPYMIVHRDRDPVKILDVVDARRDLAKMLRSIPTP